MLHREHRVGKRPDDASSQCRAIVRSWLATRPWHRWKTDPDTVRFIKERATPHRRLHYVTFDAYRRRGASTSLPSHITRAWVILVEKHGDSWRVSAGCGGTTVRNYSYASCAAKPWVSLSGGGWPNHFYAGGAVIAGAGKVARLRLRCANGLTLEDDTADGVCLFVTEDHAQVPVSVELCDHMGMVVARQSALDC
jgi:hypothetical protein